MKKSDVPVPQKMIKLGFITGLGDVVREELREHGFEVVLEEGDAIFIPCSKENLQGAHKLRSVSRAYVAIRDLRYHPDYLSRHKSIISELIGVVFGGSGSTFECFSIRSAGSDSPEVRSIAAYIFETHSLPERDEADLKLHIIKTAGTWELGAQISRRPLSVRDYRVRNMSGAMDPTIACAMNTLASPKGGEAYLNVFSGSGTLLIEAALAYPTLQKLVGFDYEKKHLSLSIQNIKKARLIERVTVKEADVFENPDLGTFDIIVSDLPFGMVVSKGEDLETLYSRFLDYAGQFLNTGGRLVVYTSQCDLFEQVLQKSSFVITRSLPLKFMTSVDAYLRPKIYLCQRSV